MTVSHVLRNSNSNPISDIWRNKNIKRKPYLKLRLHCKSKNEYSILPLGETTVQNGHELNGSFALHLVAASAQENQSGWSVGLRFDFYATRLWNFLDKFF